MPVARPILVVVALTLACAPSSDRYTQPDPDPAPNPIPTHAVGSLAALPPALAAAFADTPHFAPLRTPGSNDWLSSRKEPGQTVAQFIATDPNRPSPDRHIIYLQPIGPFSNFTPSMQTLADYTSAFFGLEVAILDPITPESLHATTRDHEFGPQLRTDDVLVALEQLLPPDAFLLVGLTMSDLYPGDDWNYVFGFASFKKRVSVYSLLRFDPLIDGPVEATKPDLRRALILRRSLKVMSHELTHSFGIRHCIHYDCVMNGANHAGEVDIHPMHVCPVCLRKLHVALDLDPVGHYERLGAFYDKHAIASEAEWIAERLDYLRAQ